jgi:hypothetical protein
MPNREDEYWQGRKEGELYCPKHKRFYTPEFGCQICYLEKEKEKSSPKPPNDVIVIKCPQCHKVSLLWRTDLEKYECVNPKCLREFTKELLLIENKGIPIEEIITFPIKKPIDFLNKTKFEDPPS